MDYRNLMSWAVRPQVVRSVVSAFSVIITVSSCAPVSPPDPQAKLIAKGKEVFFNETFNGNGRTCGTCHPLQNSLTLDPAFIVDVYGDDVEAMRQRFEDALAQAREAEAAGWEIAEDGLEIML